jgi:hypothetical protein
VTDSRPAFGRASYGPAGYGSSGMSPGVPQSPRGDTLADLLERVLDKGVVIAGDIVVNVLDIELLTLKVRLLIASADTAKEMGIDWWTGDPFLSSQAKQLETENRELRDRLERLERAIEGSGEALEPAEDGSEERRRTR